MVSKLFIFSLGSLLLGYSIGVYVGAQAPLDVTVRSTLCALGIK